MELMLVRLAPSKLRDISRAFTGGNAAQLTYLTREIGLYGLWHIPAEQNDIRLAVTGDPEGEIPAELGSGIRDALTFLFIDKMNIVTAMIGDILGEDVPEQPANSELAEDTLMVVEKVKDLLQEHPQIFHED